MDTSSSLRSAILLVVALATGACSTRDANLAPASGAPAYVPGNSAPPMLTAASNALVGPLWVWQRTRWPDGREIVTATPDRYTLRFEAGGRVLLRSDCNRGSASYEVDGGSIKMSPAALTKMGCPAGSQDNDFAPALTRATGYSISQGELTLRLADGGTMHFRAGP